MIKQIRASYSNNKKNAQYCALSTDNLPNYLKNGDEVYFIDTGKSYIYNEQTGELVEGTLSGGGASSLAGLSDVNISDNPEPNSILLYNNYPEEEWRDINFGAAVREVTGRNSDTPGVLTIGNAADLHVNSGIVLTGEIAESVMTLIQAAIANGKYSADFPASKVSQLLNAVGLNTYLNAPTYLSIYLSTAGSFTMSLVSATSTSVAWMGVFNTNTLDKIYRITLHVFMGQDALVGIGSAKAEELMTLDID